MEKQNKNVTATTVRLEAYAKNLKDYGKKK